jgi:membrane protease YdiL (CAAX protease family)
MLLLKSQSFDPGSSGLLARGNLFKTRAILWALLLFAIAFGSMLASVFGASWLHLRGNFAYLPAIAVPVLAFYVYVLLVHRFEKRKVWEFQASPAIVSEVTLGFVFGGVFIAAMWGLLCAFGMYGVHRGVWTRWFDDFVFDSYISAVVEEIAFRAILFRIFARLWGVRSGVLLSSLLFGLVHITHGSWLGVLGIAINGGITMALLYVITGRLWMSIGMHLGYDFIETSVLGVGSDHGLLISTPNPHAAAWLTGGSFGPDAAVPAMILGLLINIVLWRFAFGSRSNPGALNERGPSSVSPTA